MLQSLLYYIYIKEKRKTEKKTRKEEAKIYIS